MTIENGELKAIGFNITIDGEIVNVTNPDLNVLKIASNAGFSIPAPCFEDKRKYGACKVCVVEINKKQSFACRCKPKKGMQIIVDREDLNALRKEQLFEYKKKVEAKGNKYCRK